MTTEQRTTYYITAKDLPCAVALDDVTYAEALGVAGQCVADGQVLIGPDDGTEGYVVSFDRVPGVKVSPRAPSGAAMLMPSALVKELLRAYEDDAAHVPDDERRNLSA